MCSSDLFPSHDTLGGDGAVLDTEDEIKIETVKDGGNFKELVEYIDNQIREVILGGNLTLSLQYNLYIL